MHTHLLLMSGSGHQQNHEGLGEKMILCFFLYFLLLIYSIWSDAVPASEPQSIWFGETLLGCSHLTAEVEWMVGKVLHGTLKNHIPPCPLTSKISFI